MSQENLMVFTGNANPALADGVAHQLGIPLGKAVVSRFSDGEIVVEINENVRGKDVYVLQSTCAPTNDHLMEVMLMVDALKRSSAGRITAVLPYLVIRDRIAARALRALRFQPKWWRICCRKRA
jgi:ribose-phosphate pyrophosphokinase